MAKGRVYQIHKATNSESEASVISHSVNDIAIRAKHNHNCVANGENSDLTALTVPVMAKGSRVNSYFWADFKEHHVSYSCAPLSLLQLCGYTLSVSLPWYCSGESSIPIYCCMMVNAMKRIFVSSFWRNGLTV